MATGSPRGRSRLVCLPSTSLKSCTPKGSKRKPRADDALFLTFITRQPRRTSKKYSIAARVEPLSSAGLVTGASVHVCESLSVREIVGSVADIRMHSSGPHPNPVMQ